jgi:hypothetical protein
MSPRIQAILFMALGGVIVAASAFLIGTVLRGEAARAATVYTRSVSCGANDFFPAISTDYYTYSPDDGTVVRAAPSNPTEFVCNPRLPNGAVVRRVEFTIHDHDSSGAVTKCGLYRSSLAAADAGSVDTVAVVADTSAAGIPGTIRRSTTVIQNGNVQNASFAYLMRCQLDEAGGIPLTGLPKIAIFGSDVVYTITADKG